MGDKHYNVRLKIRAMMRDAQQQCDTMELTTLGKMVVDESCGRYVIVYDEGENSGMLGSHTRLELQDGRVEMSRQGECAITMHFEKDKQFISQYQTEHGALVVSTFTNRVMYQMQDRGGKISLGYLINIESGPSTENSLFIDVKVL